MLVLGPIFFLRFSGYGGLVFLLFFLLVLVGLPLADAYFLKTEKPGLPEKPADPAHAKEEVES